MAATAPQAGAAARERAAGRPANGGGLRAAGCGALGVLRARRRDHVPIGLCGAWCSASSNHQRAGRGQAAQPRGPGWLRPRPACVTSQRGAGSGSPPARGRVSARDRRGRRGTCRCGKESAAGREPGSGRAAVGSSPGRGSGNRCCARPGARGGGRGRGRGTNVRLHRRQDGEARAEGPPRGRGGRCPVRPRAGLRLVRGAEKLRRRRRNGVRGRPEWKQPECPPTDARAPTAGPRAAERPRPPQVQEPGGPGRTEPTTRGDQTQEAARGARTREDTP